MDSPTLATIKNKVEEDLDLEDETFIESAELTALVNEAIDAAEQIVHTLSEDYFLSYANISLVSGTSEYSLPTDIYADKIRRVTFNDGSDKYEIRRLTGSGRFEEILDIESDDDYRYMLINTSAGKKLKLYPASRVTSATYCTIWYIRNAKTLSGSSDACDIPEAFNYIVAHTKGLCLAKESGGTIPADAREHIDREAKLLTETLTQRVPDEHSELEGDFSTYDTHA